MAEDRQYYEEVGKALVQLVKLLFNGQSAESPFGETPGVITQTIQRMREELDSYYQSLSELELRVKELGESVGALRGQRPVQTQGQVHRFRVAGPQNRPRIRSTQDHRPYSVRLSKKEVQERALKAAEELAQEGLPITMASVAERAGLQYGQITYAFGRREALLEALEARQKQAAGEE